MCFEFIRVVAVIVLLVVAACLATPSGRLPLALRGIRRMLRKDAGDAPPAAEAKASHRRRAIAFLLVLAATALALV